MAGDRRRPHQYDFRAPVEQPLEFGHAALRDRRVHDRCGEDPIPVVERPFVVEPLIERVDDGARQFGVVGESDLEQTGQRREHQRGIETEFVEQRQPGLGGAELLAGTYRLSGQFSQRLAFRVVAGEVFGERPGPRDDFEGGVRDVVTDDVVDGDLRAPIHLHVLKESVVLLG